MLLLPLTAIFWGLSAFRRWLFSNGFKASTRIPVPVIVVGNISVGGNGKTPLVVYLANRLKQEGYHPGVLSRGYGGKRKNYPFSVEVNSSADSVGDEPILMKQHINCPLVVDPVRARGAKALVSKHNCNVIICDDGLQHYALQRDIEIAVVDGQRRTGNNMLMPAGPLREGVWRLDTVDFVVLNSGTVKNNEYSMSLESGRLVNIKQKNLSRSIADLKGPIVAAAGIGNPQRFFDFLALKQVSMKQCLAFDDHYRFEEKDLPKECVVMTEKDAVKCVDFAHEDWWYLPVRAKLPQQFDSELLVKLKAVATAKNGEKK
ncbi:tetraacyldisaccharide 4'-kinase [Paraglaciecola aquimarina]|uniref:Tetraacyldisaccharide 4'-kinase n=1 Tax=Paraglaciecola aquimarina TaxID=1235557 RepID=A0ABU3SYF3_9ALTE|nr:tetraacyldisaccharide 4'-kinase [Paraglaciecola aquimarina]MDU0355042.1 tetraacyldisaccharide 4'-kinase [Paraglaciecola aquimarina]